jgi:hypothetical protein
MSEIISGSESRSGARLPDFFFMNKQPRTVQKG